MPFASGALEGATLQTTVTLLLSLMRMGPRFGSGMVGEYVIETTGASVDPASPAGIPPTPTGCASPPASELVIPPSIGPPACPPAPNNPPSPSEGPMTLSESDGAWSLRPHAAKSPLARTKYAEKICCFIPVCPVAR